MRIASYLKTRAVGGPWRIEGCAGDGFAGVVVIPALAESTSLPTSGRAGDFQNREPLKAVAIPSCAALASVVVHGASFFVIIET